MSSLNRPGGTAGTPVDPASPGGILIDPETELSGSPGLNEVIKGDGLGGWSIGPAPHGPTWKELLLVPEQLLDGSAGGILQAILAKMDTNPTATNTFEITDGTTTETFTFQAGVSAGFGVQILGSSALTQAELVARINAVSTLWSAVECAALDKYFSPTAGDPQFVVYRTATSSASDRVFGTLTAPAGIQVVAFTGASDYQETGGIQTDLPAADPATKRFGFERDFAGLQQNHLHSIACDQTQYVWDADDEVWRNTGSSTPSASETASGIAELATQVETDTGTDDARIVTPLKLATSTQVKRFVLTFSTTGGVPGGGTRYLDHEGIAVSSVPVRMPATVHIIGMAIRSDAAEAARIYDVVVVANPGTSDTPLLGAALTLPAGVNTASSRALTGTVTAAVDWGVLITRTSGGGASTFANLRVELEVRMP